MKAIPFFCLAAILPLYGDSFETLPPGPLTAGSETLGRWIAEPGHAKIESGHAKTGARSLRLSGEGERQATLQLSTPTAKGTVLSFYAERWTKRDPFRFRIDAKTRQGWEEIHQADQIAVGGFETQLKVTLPEGTRELRFRSTAPSEAGTMIDDLELLLPGPARAVAIETRQPVCPAFIRETFNPVLGFSLRIQGSEGTVKLEELDLGFEGTTDLADITSYQVFRGSSNPSIRPTEVIAEGSVSAGHLRLKTRLELPPGTHDFWISPSLQKNASLNHRVDASLYSVRINGRVLQPNTPSPEGSQQIGFAVRLPGDDQSKAYRIPGLTRTRDGSLLAVYDIRYQHSGDLPANIDVGLSRSTDGGQSWEPMRIALDMGKDPKFGYDGVGDPAILTDPTNGRIWIAALWSHGNRAWNGSGPGLKPEETGQLMLVHSDDDGKTWSKPINITRQVKDPAQRLFFNGPGAGIALKNGTLIFPAQYRAADGKPWSTLISSTDHGTTWQAGTGVKSDTTEAQVAELLDGTIMINCRDNRGGSRTIATTRDLGKSWELHPSDRKALREPVCMGSLLAWNRALWFSNPDATDGRHLMTVKRSIDQGLTWPESDARLYDSRSGFGYSCLAPVDDEHFGVLYEGAGTLYFLRFPLDGWSSTRPLERQ